MAIVDLRMDDIGAAYEVNAADKPSHIRIEPVSTIDHLINGIHPNPNIDKIAKDTRCIQIDGYQWLPTAHGGAVGATDAVHRNNIKVLIDGVMEQTKLVGNSNLNAVSYTHLTLPTTPYV